VRRVLLVLLALVAGTASAHEIRPIYLQLEESAPGQVEVLLKLPLFRDRGIAAAYAVFPPGCRESLRSPVREAEETAIQTWRLSCTGPLSGQIVRIEGFSTLAPDALLRVRHEGGEEANYILSATQPQVVLQRPGSDAGPGAGLGEFFPIGIEHILLGFDHLLFVLGLLLVVWRAGAGAGVLLATITAFTVAHSLTLALAVLGAVALPGATVETLIAASILLLAVELARSLRDAHAAPAGLTFRKPWLVALVFGLLHGFGFAAALRDTGLPPQDQGWALLLFNAGVEAGQLLFVAAVIVGWRLTGLVLQLPPAPAAHTLSFLLGTVSAAWTIDRALAVFA